MISMTLDVSAEAQKILDINEPRVEAFISGMMNEMTEQLLEVIIQPGMCPVDKGDLREGHFAEIIAPLVKYIKCRVAYWVDVVYGHKTMVTEEQKLWWFWYLNTVLGGSYQRKTNGPTGYVPPDDYPNRAYVEWRMGGTMEAVIQKHVALFVGGI